MTGIGLAARYRRLIWLLLPVVVGGAFYFGWMQPRPIHEKKRERVASLHEIGALPKDYDGWLAHVEAELLAEGEERPPDPLFPDTAQLKSAIIVDVNAKGEIFLNARAMKSEALIDILKRVFDGVTEPDPITFRVAMDARIAEVETVAQAIVAAGYGEALRPILFGDEFSRVYSIKLGERFMRVVVYRKWVGP